MRLRTATGESATVDGETEMKVKIGNVRVSHVFIVADIVDEVVIAVDFMIAYSMNLNMGQQIMSWRNVKTPLDVESNARQEDSYNRPTKITT